MTDLKELLDFAIAKEQEAADFYRQVSELDFSADSKAMLLEFAAEESRHRRLLEDLKTKDVDTALAGYDWKWIIDIKRSNYSEELVVRPGMSYRDIMLLACQREESALALYNGLLKAAEDEGSRKLLKMLCQEEARHKLGLEGLLDDHMAAMGD